MDRRARRSSSWSWSWPLLRVAGITVRLHVTLVALVVLVAVSAGDAGESVPAAVGGLVALFACIVVHELSHALVARSKGIDVHEIDLLALGGVSRLERLPDRWRDEAAIAAAGPIASGSLAALAFLVAAGAGLPLLPPAMWSGPLPVRLGWANLMLAAFNLVPAFPLDGGRVLRALLERRRSRVDATRLAARISRAVAAVMIAAGLMGDLWLVLIGVFVVVAGSAEEAAVLVHAALGSIAAGRVAQPCPVSFQAGEPAAEAARMADLHPQPAYPVEDERGACVGTVTSSDLQEAAPAAAVGDVVAGGVVDERASLEDVAALIEAGPVAVTSGGRVVGVVTLEVLEREMEAFAPK